MAAAEIFENMEDDEDVDREQRPVVKMQDLKKTR